MTAWEQGWTRGPSRPSLRARRRLRHLRAPADGDPAAAVWADLDEQQRDQLRWYAAEDLESPDPHRAVVLAALQRRIEARRDRWLPAQLAGVLVLFVGVVALSPGSAHGSVFAGLVGGGLGHLQEVRTTRARRANEARAREAGYLVAGGARAQRWGLDRPVTGDPLASVAVLTAAALWLLPWPEVHPVARVLALPVVVVAVAVVLGTVRGFVLGLREG